MRLFSWPKYSYTLIGGTEGIYSQPKTSAIFSKPLIGLIVAYLVTFISLWISKSADPTSWFFNDDVGYTPAYSAFRRQQAETYIDQVKSQTLRFNPSDGETTVCLGVPTFARHGARYFRSTIGSLLHDLDPVERKRIYLLPFVAHTDPLKHPAYSEPWLSQVADHVLVYNQSDPGFEHTKELETTLNFREKALLDYIYLLKACQETGTDYTAILEDDVIAMDGWFYRTMAGLKQIEALAPDFLYLRLFFTEEFLGWNSENWRQYLAASLLAVITVACAQLILRRRIPSARRYLENWAVVAISLVYVPLCILLFFAAGTGVVRRWQYPSGVNVMENYGCCGQGFVFSQAMVQKLIPYYQDKKLGFVDMLTEEYGDHHDNLRFAIMPSVLQHIGATTSKEGVDAKPDESSKKHVRTISEKMWNFEFERHNPEVLKTEHKSAVAGLKQT
ncbi:N-Acetylglucosaminyltransferase-IV-like protein [Elsinoe australis]|uniref:N-Acetylglucosaminyltransferase-IV-like protein n=1 Tax=Elsinoe australis TaxID=40998 RepID=A0A4U7BE27_9PEZI|nr:N-Acetylglucosaminyltransferase-IV-like protein [Elsinoe australis]